jgi:hypothetical protein
VSSRQVLFVDKSLTCFLHPSHWLGVCDHEMETLHVACMILYRGDRVQCDAGFTLTHAAVLISPSRYCRSAASLCLPALP